MVNTLPLIDNAYCGLREPGQPAPVIAIGDSFNNETLAKARGCFPCRDWDKAEYRYPTALSDFAVNIEITGRKEYWRDGTSWVRGRVTFVGDCEPDTSCGCWVRLS